MIEYNRIRNHLFVCFNRVAGYTDGFDMQSAYQMKEKNQMKLLNYVWPEQLGKLFLSPKEMKIAFYQLFKLVKQ